MPAMAARALSELENASCSLPAGEELPLLLLPLPLPSTKAAESVVS